MVDPKVLLIILALSGGWWVGEQAVHGLHKVDVAVVHVVKHIGHGLKHLVGK